jgi:hypothetical protein
VWVTCGLADLVALEEEHAQLMATLRQAGGGDGHEQNSTLESVRGVWEVAS